ncbi:MAG: thermonuclease family protein [Planctomycetota bacterium]
MPRRERVTRVIDGDTFQSGSRKRPVRLAGVDTPEKGQRGYVAAKEALEQLIGGRKVLIETKARDAYGRSVANVKVGGKSVNRAMKQHGK